MAFQKGQSGNPGGKSHLKVLTDSLRRKLVQNPESVMRITDQVVKHAEEGDLAYINFIFNRLEGSVIQNVQTTHVVSRDDDRLTIDITPTRMIAADGWSCCPF